MAEIYSNPAGSNPEGADTQAASPAFVAIGECMVEMAPSGAASQFRMSFAGDTFNTAWYFKQLCPNHRSRFVSRVGQDAVSDEMLAMASRAGIDVSHIGRSAERSIGLYLISLIDGERSFSYWRDQSAARQLADDTAALEAATADAGIVYFSGITLGILSPLARQTLLDVVAAARAAGKTIAFDSNLRPRLWKNAEEMCSAVMQAAAVSDIVLPSHDDEALHFGDANALATRDRYLGAGAKTVIVKDGPGAVHFAHDGLTGQVSPPVAGQIVDTTAAGDSFNGGFFAGYTQGAAIDDAINLAACVAGQVIGQRGALVALDRSRLPAV